MNAADRAAFRGLLAAYLTGAAIVAVSVVRWLIA